MEVLYNIFVLFILPFGIAAFILFYVMKAAVKSALDDIRVQKNKDSLKEAVNEGFEALIALRDLELLSDSELEEAIVMCKNDKADKEVLERFKNYAKTLDDLKAKGYFSDEQYNEKTVALKKHFNID
jgi:hypothetical protein